MKYANAAAFRQALDDRLKSEAARTGLGIARLRKRVAFELFLRRLVAVAPDRWVLKDALALDFRFHSTSRPTRVSHPGFRGQRNAGLLKANPYVFLESIKLVVPSPECPRRSMASRFCAHISCVSRRHGWRCSEYLGSFLRT